MFRVLNQISKIIVDSKKSKNTCKAVGRKALKLKNKIKKLIVFDSHALPPFFPIFSIRYPCCSLSNPYTEHTRISCAVQ